MQMFEHDDCILASTKLEGNPTKLFILSVDLVSVLQAPTPKSRGTMRRGTTPIAADEIMMVSVMMIVMSNWEMVDSDSEQQAMSKEQKTMSKQFI